MPTSAAITSTNMTVSRSRAVSSNGSKDSATASLSIRLLHLLLPPDGRHPPSAGTVISQQRAKVKATAYPAREAGTVIWIWIWSSVHHDPGDVASGKALMLK